ncbi:MAG: c-type cytochrome [Cocleimonas sp.]|nr:c-type cytochrome [Cocleimonas sp.]
MKKQFITTSFFIFLLGSAGAAFAASPDETAEAMKLTPNIGNGKKTYELCASCHADNGWGKEDGSFPVIAGQHRSVIIKQLADIRARNRENPTMYPFSGDDVIGGPQGLEDVAEYISQLPKALEVGQGDGKQLEKGEKLYLEKCIACHGDKGQGNAGSFFPRIQGQHYAYTFRQLQWIRDGRRKNANPAMLALIKDLDDETLSSIADYVSRIKVDK